MSINAERKMAEKYFLETDTTTEGEKVVQLTKRNVAKAEAMIASNSTYKKSADPTCKPEEGKYKGSTAYWVKSFDNYVNNGDGTYSYQDIIENIVKAVDRENSTHLNADEEGYAEITRRIHDHDPSNLISLLKNPTPAAGPKYVLIDELSKPVQSEVTKNEETIIKSRSNFSFATKFCHYMAFYLFDGKRSRDNFSIYDGIMEKAIRKHAEQLGVDIPNDMKSFKGHYVEYMKTIDGVRDACKKKGQNISRNGLDHLLWYYYK